MLDAMALSLIPLSIALAMIGYGIFGLFKARMGIRRKRR